MGLGRIRWSFGIMVILAMGWGVSSPADSRVQYQFQIVHSFGAPGDGVGPGSIVMDGRGNLYGVTTSGGAYGYGTVFELTPDANREWTETILHSFPVNDPTDGWDPIGLVIDEAGNLYGTTVFGGDGQYCTGDGCGTVFELSPSANGVWAESILWNFCSQPSCADGVSPLVAPTLGPGGNLYGIAAYAAYQLTPSSGGWTFTLLYTFCSQPACNPTSSLLLDPKGNLYGEGGIGHGVGDCLYQFGCGVVFALHRQPEGQWNEVLLWEFDKYGHQDGIGPEGGLTFHDDGLYGVTAAGGSNCVKMGGCGTVFELARGSGHKVNEQIPWDFGANEALGSRPGSWVVFDSQGDLFGVTILGGEYEDGVVYGMRKQTNGKWEYAVLHTFDGTDGLDPNSGLAMDSKGDLFGTTGGGGQYGGGVAYELSPMSGVLR